MKIILLLIFSLVITTCFSQQDHTDFIKCRKITWAADVTDTISFQTINLSLLFRQNLIQRKIKASLADENFQLSKRNTTDAEAVRNRIAPNRTMEMVDENGVITGAVTDADDPLLSDKYFDSLTGKLLEAKEIIFIKNGKPVSYVPWVSAKYNVYTSWGQNLGMSNAFNTAFNTSYKLRRSLSGRAKIIGKSKKYFVLNVPETKMLKQLYEQNFIEALWPHLDKKYYRFYDLTRSAPISFADIDNSLVDSREVTVPVYDSAGNATTRKIPFPPLSLSDIYAIDIIENWYYNPGKQKVFSKINSIVLYAKRWKDGIQQEVASPILNIAVD